jgi:hypothetical protein
MSTGISVKLPLQYNKEDGPYQLTKTLKETVKQNFKNLILTNPGERIMDPNFGVGLHRFLFESSAEETISAIHERIAQQTSRYLPFIDLMNVDINFIEDTYTLNVAIQYFIGPLSTPDQLSLELINT